MGMKTANRLKVAAIQMVSATDLDKNLDTACRLIEKAKSLGAELVVLPEYFCFMGKTDKDKLKLVEEHGNGEIQRYLSALARENAIHIVGGSMPIQSSDPLRPLSRCYVYADNGDVLSYYDKVHLFDVNVEDGTRNYRESKHCMPGEEVASFNMLGQKAGVAICYDIRFPEMFRQFAQQGCQLIFVPAAFTQVTGEAHWHVLLRARAIENQVFIIAAAQGGKHQNQRETYGHSCIVSPWGEVIAEHSYGSGVVFAELDLDKQQELRNEFPVLAHTRL